MRKDFVKSWEKSDILPVWSVTLDIQKEARKEVGHHHYHHDLLKLEIETFSEAAVQEQTN